jgi:hypothetical protein
MEFARTALSLYYQHRPRGQGLKTPLGEPLQEEIRRPGLLGLYAEAVTVHTISQEAAFGAQAN